MVLRIVTLVWQVIWLFIVEFINRFKPAKCKDITGEIALVTGAGRGLGKEIAILLAAKGCTVVLVDLNLDSVQRVAAEIVQNGGKAVAMECDIADEEGVVQLQRQVEETVGLVGILVNNAGMILMQNFMKTKLANIERVVTVNVVGTMFMTRLFLEGMIKRRKGHILTISSSALYYPMPWAVVYATTKSASSAFMDVLQDQLWFEGHSDYIKTTTVLPYILNTEAARGSTYTTEFLDPRVAAVQIVEAMQTDMTVAGIPFSLLGQLKFWSWLPKQIQWFYRKEIINERQYYRNMDDKEETRLIVDKKNK